jgi:hypothetical protein
MLKSVSALLLFAACALAHASANDLRLNYDLRKRVISLTANGRTVQIERIGKGQGPELVDMERYIRILPAELQLYQERGIILLTTASRSAAGDGRGQCGAGYEMYLYAVDVSRRTPRQMGRVLVGSCWKNLYPDGVENGPEDFSAFSVENGALRVHLLGRSATLAGTLDRLDFDSEQN